MIKQPTAIIVCIFLLAALIRGFFFSVVVQHPDRLQFGDSGSYIGHAEKIAHERRHYFQYDIFSVPSDRPIAYPAFLALIFSLHLGKLTVILLQNLATLLTLWFVFKIGKSLWGDWAAIAAAFLYAIGPGGILYAQYIITETLFTFFITWGFYLLLVGLQENRTYWLYYSAIVFGISAHIRSTGMFLILAPLIIPLLTNKLSLRSFLLRRILVISAIFFVMILPWALRNQMLLGKFFFSSHNKLGAVASHFVQTIAKAENITDKEIFDRLAIGYYNDIQALAAAGMASPDPIRYRNAQDVMGTWERNPFALDYFYKQSLLLMRPYWKNYVIGVGINVVRMAFFPMSSRNEDLLNFLGIASPPIVPVRSEMQSNLKEGNWGSAIHFFFTQRFGWYPARLKALWLAISLFEFFLFTGALLGCALIYFTKTRSEILVAGFILGMVIYFIAVPGIATDLRFRIPAEPFLSLLAGSAISSVWTLLSSRTKLHTK